MTITKWTLRQRKWSILWWVVGIAAYIALTLIFYPTIHNQTDQLNKSFDQIPQSAKALFTDTQDLFSPVGYLSSQLYYLMLPLLFTVLAIGLGSGLIAKEESAGTIELLLSRPVSRTKFLIQKALAGLVILAAVGLASLVCTVLLCYAVNLNVSKPAIAVATLYSVALAAVFGAVAYFVASLGRLGRLASVGVAAMIALLSYLISSLESVVSWLKWPAKLLPNHYYHPGDILSGHCTWLPLLFFAAVIIILGALSAVAFARRDLSGN